MQYLLSINNLLKLKKMNCTSYVIERLLTIRSDENVATLNIYRRVRMV
jgi:hypothetical protein